MKAVFLGTPRFAVPSLERMVAAGHEVVAVFTQPDRPRGREQKHAAPPVKEVVPPEKQEDVEVRRTA